MRRRIYLLHPPFDNLLAWREQIEGGNFSMFFDEQRQEIRHGLFVLGEAAQVRVEIVRARSEVLLALRMGRLVKLRTGG